MERNLNPEEARKELISLVRQGRTIADALKVVGRSRSWYDTQRREAPGFSALIDNVRFRTQDLAQDARSNLSDFAEFSEKYLGAKVWDHMLNVVDMLEGKEPRWIDPAMTYRTHQICRLMKIKNRNNKRRTNESTKSISRTDGL